MFHNLGADREKARSAVLLSALEIVFGTNKEILFRERRPGREGTWRRISSDICWGFIMDTFESKGEKFIFNPSLDRQPVELLQNWSDVVVLRDFTDNSGGIVLETL